MFKQKPLPPDCRRKGLRCQIGCARQRPIQTSSLAGWRTASWRAWSWLIVTSVASGALTCQALLKCLARQSAWHVMAGKQKALPGSFLAWQGFCAGWIGCVAIPSTTRRPCRPGKASSTWGTSRRAIGSPW